MPRLLLVLSLLLLTLSSSAQNVSPIEAQKRVIEALERKIAAEETQISKLQKGRTATEERVRRLARQIESRNQLLDETEKQIRLLRDDITEKDREMAGLSQSLDKNRVQYADMVRDSYRNYRHNNYLTYLFASRDFIDMARKLANVRHVAELRERKMQEISDLSSTVRTERSALEERKQSLDTELRKLTAQRTKLERDARSARASVRSLSQKEKTALRQKMAQEQQLDIAISELRKLSKGNTTGSSFSTNTSGLRLPVSSGRVKRYKDNMAEIVGPKGASVVSIYEGKVVDVKRNRITAKYDVFVAHGEYITSYANLGSIAVEKGQKVARDERLGTIGASVDIMTMQTEYKLIFGIYPPNAAERMKAESCFKR